MGRLLKFKLVCMKKEPRCGALRLLKNKEPAFSSDSIKNMEKGARVVRLPLADVELHHQREFPPDVRELLLGVGEGRLDEANRSLGNSDCVFEFSPHFFEHGGVDDSFWYFGFRLLELAAETHQSPVGFGQIGLGHLEPILVLGIERHRARVGIVPNPHLLPTWPIWRVTERHTESSSMSTVT